MMLHFDAALVRQLLDHALAAPKHRKVYGETKTGPGLWLVGDEGVYLMSNGDPAQPGTDGKPVFVAYAREVDPHKMDFETWWAAKKATFGGDDGIEFLDAARVAPPLDSCQGDDPFRLNITSRSITIHGYQKPARKRKS